MSDLDFNQILKLDTFNQLAVEAPGELINICENYYRTQIVGAVEKIIRKNGRKIIMLSGPSSSGKTTTAHLITARLKEHGVRSTVISLDDFYKGREKAPRNSDGSFDYETVHALDIEVMQSCLRSLVVTGECSKPVFDFITGKPKSEREKITVGENDAVIVEGIHALNPLVVQSLPSDHLIKIYITVRSTVRDDENKHVISRRGTRLSRRILRDFKYRGTAPSETLEMWNEVENGENRYLFPFEGEAEYTIDSFHPYELCIMKDIIMPRLSEIDTSAANYDRIERLIEGYGRVASISLDLLPKDSLLMEFLG